MSDSVNNSNCTILAPYMQIREKITFFILLLVVGFLFLGSLTFGSVDIPFEEILNILSGEVAPKRSWTLIVEARLTASLTAIFAGISLSISGLLMQNIFQNPLAGPGVLGITSGSNLGVALVFLFAGSQSNVVALSVTAAILGALSVLFLIIGISLRVRNNVIVLISGLMLSYLCGAGVNIILNYSDKNQIQQFVNWGFGNFSSVHPDSIFILLSLLSGFIILLFLLSKYWNALVLGEKFAGTLGVPVFRIRLIGILITGILTGLVTAYCGPIAFVGIAVPHISRMLIARNNHFIMIPLNILVGAAICLIGLIFTKYPFPLPLNAVTSLIGAPVILWILISKKAGWKNG
ncbi:MAG: iron ABC transporter permease [Crocinitomicaceae bacterium]